MPGHTFRWFAPYQTAKIKTISRDTPTVHEPGPRAALKKAALTLLTVSCVLVYAPAPFAADNPQERRIALVIGNSEYKGDPLLNPVNDAKAMANALKKAGFIVDLKINASQKAMQQSITEFGDALKKDGVGLFYFAGHGLQIKDRNFLVPVGDNISREDEVPYKAVDVQQVLDKMESANNRLNLVILDACRNNPFAKKSRSTGGKGGLSQMDAPVGSLLAFSTAPGSVASDGDGSNGLYTQHLLANIEQPGLRIEEVFKRVRLGVRLDSDGQQIPWENTSLEGDFFFHPGQSTISVPTLPRPPGTQFIAKAEAAYNRLRENKIDEAEKSFRELSANPQQEVVYMGREGLAEVALIRGDLERAIREANEIISKAPQRSTAYLIRGRAQALLGQTQQASQALNRAADGKTSADFSWQKANALVAAGNIERKENTPLAIKRYEQAAKENPDSVDALNNMAVVLKDSGQPEKALQVLEKTQQKLPADTMTQALLRQLKDAVAQQQDAARQKFIDDSVKELSARFKENRLQSAGKPSDDWTSPVMAISILPFQDNTTQLVDGRIGFDSLLLQELNRELLALGIPVVERAILDKVMAELKLGSSELADQDTQIKLGKLFAARLMISGSLDAQAQGLSAGIRAIDTETTRLALARSEQIASRNNPVALAQQLANAIRTTLKEKYPLKGRVAAVDGDNVIINLGKKHGVVPGQTFNVLKQGEPIELNGRILGYKDVRIAQLTVTESDELMSYTQLNDAKGTVEKNQKIIVRDK